MKKTLLTITVFLITIFNIIGQEKTVIGKVNSVDDDLGLPGVTVLIKGTTNGTLTDIDGTFSLSGVTNSNSLIFRYIGYKTLEIEVVEKKIFNIVMEESAVILDEVVVTALGVKRQKRKIGYSTEKIETDVLVRSSTPNVLNAIIGRSAGVQVSQGDGLEGGTTRITIRGNNSFDRYNQPLIVVDNVPMENTPGITSIGRGTDWGNPLADINPLDIEDYTVLKGGAASALYGSRGANGVILITTKKGRKQKGIGVTYNVSHKMITPYRFREMQNKYGHGGPISFTPPTFPIENDTLIYPGIYGNENLIINQEGDISSTSSEFGYYGSAVSWGPKMEGQMIKWWDGKMRSYSPQPQNYKETFHTGYTQTHNLAISGGGEKGTMRVSFTRQDHKPIIDNSNFNRNTINIGSSLKLSRKILVDFNFSYINYYRKNSPVIGDTGNSFSKGFLYSWPRSYKALDKTNRENPDGSQNNQEGFPFFYIYPSLWWNYYNNNTELKRDKYIGALTVSYDVTSWLKMLGRVGKDFSLEQIESRNKPIDVVGIQGGQYSNSLRKTYSDVYEAFLTAEKENIFNSKLSTRLTLGTSRWNSNLYSIGAQSGTWTYPNRYTFNNYKETTYTTNSAGETVIDENGDSAGSLLPSERISRERNNSVFSFLNISWDNYLFLELTGRNDWSSTLPASDNSYFYPSFSLSFVATEAFPIQKNIHWINFLKIRGGIAQTANDADPYQLDFYYSTGKFGGEQTSAYPSTIPPFVLKPQRVNSYEAGLNLGLFENKIDLDFTYYYLYSYSQILRNLPVPASSGATGITINEGTLTNQGLELILNTVPIQTRNFLFKTGINFTKNTNHVVSLGEYADILPLADIWGFNGPAMALRVGDQYGTIYGYDYVYHENGKPIVNDAGTKYLITDTRVPIGNASPDFLAGWTTEFHYKGLTLSTLIDTKWGGDIYSGSYVIGLQTGLSPETLKEREGGGLPYTDPDGNTSNIGIKLDGVYADGTPNDKVVHYYYKYLPNAGGWGKFISTPGIVEDTWIKMREISLSYSFSPELIRKTKVFQKLTLSIVGRNLFYLYSTVPNKINPEGIMGSGNAQGFEWASLPSSRSLTIGLSASF